MRTKIFVLITEVFEPPEIVFGPGLWLVLNKQLLNETITC